ncbi:hypothetical protein AB0M36_35860 [Actinoplanes sp. NPDC051346]|uniref:hypothetical protein n=1 Tax=Actinoplanes sp. NPDC051346 TaxID=3155048 RepID=UPI00341B790F
MGAGRIVVCDRYVPSSLVLQRLDGVRDEFVRDVNAHADRPHLTGDEQRCRTRAKRRGSVDIGERDAGQVAAELYDVVLAELAAVKQ